MYKTKLKSQRHSVSMITDHMVFSPKYRGGVLAGEVGRRCQQIISDMCGEMGIEVMEIAVNTDHVHIFYQSAPRYSFSQIANRIKGKSSRILRLEFPHLAECCPKGLWASSCYHGTVGYGPEAEKNYIARQKQ